MTRPIATINGNHIYSDKSVSNIVNTKISFTDGSWCDVATGQVVNKGAGYISIGTSATADDTKKTTYGPKTFSTQSLEINDINADVEINVIDGDRMVVTIQGSASGIEAINVKENRNILTIEGNSGRSSDRGTNVGIGGFSNISVGGSIHIISGSTYISTSGVENETKLIIGVPKGSAVSISRVQGKTIIGDTEGPLHAHIFGSEDIQTGRVGDATLSVQGSGNINVSTVNGNLSMMIQGSGDIRVKDGSVNQLSANVMGSGDARFNGKAVDANLSVMGSGDISVKFVRNKPIIKMMGRGYISIDNW